MERTFALIKSHAYDNSAVIMGRIADAGLRIVRTRRGPLPVHTIVDLYSAHIEKPYWNDLHRSVSGAVVAMLLEGDDAVARWRKLMGATDPRKAAPGTIRADFGNLDGPMAENAVHGSDSLESATREIAIVFPDAALAVAAE